MKEITVAANRTRAPENDQTKIDFHVGVHLEEFHLTLWKRRAVMLPLTVFDVRGAVGWSPGEWVRQMDIRIFFDIFVRHQQPKTTEII